LSTLSRVSTGLQDEAVADAVFVHGLGGDPYKTWQSHDRAESFWPAWLAQDLPQLNVWTLGYEAAPLAWLGTAMPLGDRARNVLDLLGVEGLGKRPLSFVCHSLGGLVVKQMLRAAEDSRATEARGIREKTCAIAFLGTPHTGSPLARYLEALSFLLRVNVNIRDLETYSTPLRDLNIWFREHHGDIRILVYFETQGIKITNLFRSRTLKVVDEISVDPGISGVIPIGIDADHLTIAKPRSPKEQVYRGIAQFLKSGLPVEPLNQAPSLAALAKEYALMITTPVNGATVDAEVSLVGTFKKEPPEGSVVIVEKNLARGEYYFQAAPHFDANTSQWSGKYRIGSGERVLFIGVLGKSAQTLRNYFYRTGAHQNTWVSLTDLPPDLIMCDQVRVRRM
jgi:hypothetical protein